MIRRATRPNIAAVLLLMLSFGSLASGHQVGFSSLRVVIRDDGVDVHMTVPVADLEHWMPPTAGSTDDLIREALSRRMEREAGDFLELRENYSPVTLNSATAQFVPEMSAIRLTTRFPIPAGAGALSAVQYYSNRLSSFPDPHRQNVIVIDARGYGSGKIGPLGERGKIVARHTLTVAAFSAFDNVPPAGTGAADVAGPESLPTTQAASATQAEMRPAATEPAASPGEESFFKLGIEHILTGYDHLLFLAALLLVCRSFREAAAIITCFTVAHSITLALAAMDIVSLSPRVVEPVIAATIVYVAAENLALGKPRLYWRMALTFSFGLIHGLGFASALREAGLGTDPGGIVLPLVKFNLGVEAGQLAVAVVIFPVFLLIRRSATFSRAWIATCSCIIAALGALWFVQRVCGV